MLLRSAYLSEITIIGTIITELLVLNLPSFKKFTNREFFIKPPGGACLFQVLQRGLIG